MVSMSNRAPGVIAVLVIAGCAAISQQKVQTSRADNLEFHNLRVLPPNITHDELISTMRGFARSLGTRCNHCHVANPPGAAEEFNFASDAKPEKNTARTMLRMTRSINAQYISKVNEHGQTVTCFTCHRGHTVPETLPAEAPAP
jgi:Photosynthetic reaction centre cytochrome C subunit